MSASERFEFTLVPEAVQEQARVLSLTPTDQLSSRQLGWSENLKNVGLESTLNRMVGLVDAACYDEVEDPKLAERLGKAADEFMETVTFHLAFNVRILAVVHAVCDCECHDGTNTCANCRTDMSGYYFARAYWLDSKQAVLELANEVLVHPGAEATLVAYDPREHTA